jgi:hypothetical protein
MAIAEAPSEHDDAHAPAATTNGAGSDRDAIIKAAATIGVIGVGVALIEVALIPGMVIGVAAALAPKYLPQSMPACSRCSSPPSGAPTS